MQMEAQILYWLFILQFLFWCIAYCLALIRGWKDKTHAIPLPAILINVVWEMLACTLYREYSPIGPFMPAVWLLLDFGILLQAVLYSPREFPHLNGLAFSSLVMGGLVAGFAVFYLAHVKNIPYIWSAFPQNLMMSILFVRMLTTRNNLRGQSIYIAVFKYLGSACAIMLAMQASTLPLLYGVTFAAILVFDLLYLVLLFIRMKQLRINPLLRL